MKRITSLSCAWLLAAVTLVGGLASSAYAASNTNLSVHINDGVLAVGIVDNSSVPVASPGIPMSAIDFSFTSSQNSTGTLGTSTEKVRLSNPTGATSFAVSLAPSGATWAGSTYTMPFDDKLTVNPSGATIVETASLNDASHLAKGSSQTYNVGTIDSITLFSASGNDPKYTQYDATGITLTQSVPAGTQADNYTLSMTLTVA